MLEERTTRELLQLFCQTLSELRRRDVTRSTNNPVADVTETLVARTLNLNLVAGSTTGYDATDSSGKRYEIKGRRITSENKSRQMSFIRGLDMAHFDYLVGVLFDKDFDVMRGCVISHETVMRVSKYVKHVNGWMIILRDSVWDVAGVRDITHELRQTLKCL
ncbi:MAG TPA: hypothetical protein VGJ06_13165 [Candidatus Acidoferrum sp.]|jgi:hypothetical protein